MSISTITKWQSTLGEDLTKYKVKLLFGYTSYTPGRYLQDAFTRCGVKIVDKNEDISIWIESPTKPVPKEIKSMGGAKVCWIHHGANRINHNLKIIKSIKPDLVLMSHSLFLAEKINFPTAFFPFGVDPIFIKKNSWKNRPIDISFVGNGGKRAKNVQYLKRCEVIEAAASIAKKLGAKIDFNKRIFREDMARLYSQSKIVLNPIHNTIPSINMRLWETMGCGALALTGYADNQELLFEDNVHVKVIDNLAANIKWALNSKKSQKIANTAQDYVIKHHTYNHRVHLIFDLLRSIGKLG
jgi:spore maturation protein CgeB